MFLFPRPGLLVLAHILCISAIDEDNQSVPDSALLAFSHVKIDDSLIIFKADIWLDGTTASLLEAMLENLC